MSKVKVTLLEEQPKRVEIRCPNCKRTIHVVPGKVRCAYCNALLKVKEVK
jgi:phage FluMu protein Com